MPKAVCHYTVNNLRSRSAMWFAWRTPLVGNNLRAVTWCVVAGQMKRYKHRSFVPVILISFYTTCLFVSVCHGVRSFLIFTADKMLLSGEGAMRKLLYIHMYIVNGGLWVKDWARDSSVGWASRLRTGRSRIETLRGRGFTHLHRPALRPNQPPLLKVPGLFPGSKAVRTCC